MAGRFGVYSHEALNFPMSTGGSSGTIALPECDLWAGIAQQGSVESVSWDHIYPEDGNLLTTSPELRFHSRPSLMFR